MQHLIYLNTKQKRVTTVEYTVIAFLFIVAAVSAIVSAGGLATILEELSATVTVVSG